jgi:hypothetical protein
MRWLLVDSGRFCGGCVARFHRRQAQYALLQAELQPVAIRSAISRRLVETEGRNDNFFGRTFPLPNSMSVKSQDEERFST